ncbi:ABC transporter permease [Actinophytocola sp.]|uniref:ABC transporter permease n=1 Tax=Actinophytocola sp. TaxID=1872138 RepID=UPI002ED5464C
MTQTLAPRTGTRSAPVLALNDCLVLIGRNLRHVLRNPDQVIQVLALPVILLLLFRYLFGGAINTGDVVYVNYLIAGLLVISVAFNSTSTAVGVAADLQNGIVERFRSMPMLGQAVLIGHMVAGVLRNLLSTVILVGLGLVVGFRPTAGIGGWLGALGLLLLFMVGISWLAVLLGIVAGSVEGASGLSMIMVFLPYASSALVPADSMPAGLRFFVENQPVTPVIDAVRALLLDLPVGDSAWIALAWWLAFTALAATLAARTFRRRSSR